MVVDQLTASIKIGWSGTRAQLIQLWGGNPWT
jgi:hypothetical protein